MPVAVVQDRSAPGSSSPAGTAPLLLRRVLLVSPHFPPSNAPDHQRVRMALPYLAENGWQAEVLAVAPEFVEAPLDPDLASALPPLLVHRVRAWPQQWTRRLGWGGLSRRAYHYFNSRGNELLASGRFDLVFFSTSQFGLLPLASHWRRRYGVPFVVDFQDEWVSDYYRRHPATRPPGGRLKYGLSHLLARLQEGRVVHAAAQIVSVSAGFNRNLRLRHPELPAGKLHVVPFGGAEADFQFSQREPKRNTFFRRDGKRHWVHIGRGGPAMRLAATAFFLALLRAISEGIVSASNLQVHFIGTDYATGSQARATFAPIASRLGLGSMVDEETARVPHFTALQCLREADAVVVLGSDDPGYSASRIFPCILAHRPLLAVFRRESGCVEILRETKTGILVTFDAGDDAAAIAKRVFHRWFVSRAFLRNHPVSAVDFEPYSARTMTRHLAAIWNGACPSAGEPA